MPPLALIGHLTAGRAQMPAADTLCGAAPVRRFDDPIRRRGGSSTCRARYRPAG